MQKDIDSQLFELMFELSRNLKEKMLQMNQICNITMPQYMALSFIASRKTVQMKDIANHFAVEMPTATSLLNKLARQSLIERINDNNDRRIVKVKLSTKGESLLLEARKIKEERMKNMLSYLSMEQKNEMRGILTTLVGTK